MSQFTVEQKKEFLIKRAEKLYEHGDNHYAYQTKKGTWIYGFSNDYPLQHGEGKSIHISDREVERLMI